jgi:hypothetical protein
MTEFVNKFDTNLLWASVNKEDLIEAKKEWEFFREEKSSEKKTCICKHKILNVRYHINIHNGNIICCGTTCCKKFNFEKKEMTNKTLERIMKLKNPYDTNYKQFSNIQEYLDYAKDELDIYINKEINSSKFNNLIILLENIISINKIYSFDIFNKHIENIKLKLVELFPIYIDDEVQKDITNLFNIMNKVSKLSHNYQIERPSIEIFKNIISTMVDDNIKCYCGLTTPPLQKKFDDLVQKIEIYKNRTGKNFILKNFIQEMNQKLKDKIQLIRDQNFAYDKAKWERERKYKAYLREKYPDRYYF